MKIFVPYSRGIRTGGPEALHQFVSAARASGYDAYLVPAPHSRNKSRVPEYNHYNCPEIDTIEDDSENLVVYSENEPHRLQATKRAKKAMWWLSVDNSPIFAVERRLNNSSSRTRGIAKAGKAAVQIGLQYPRIKDVLRLVDFHFTQSVYAADYLRNRYGFFTIPVSDYTAIDTSSTVSSNVHTRRRLSIAFNARKSKWELKPLISKRSDFDWIPIENMPSEQVASVLKDADVYVDLGPHPGKDRMPREAALQNTIVIVGDRGSSGFYEDVPLPGKMKIEVANRRRKSYLSTLESTLEAIEHDRAAWLDEQQHYRDVILAEKERFHGEVSYALRYVTNAMAGRAG